MIMLFNNIFYNKKFKPNAYTYSKNLFMGLIL